MQLYQYQKDAISALYRTMREEPHGRLLIVAPTGAGKSVIIAQIISDVITKKPEYKVLIVTHRKELVEQNARELQAFLPKEPIGIYSAGLGIKRFRRITFANIQSVFKKDFPTVELVLIDEAHLLPKDTDTMYQKFISAAESKNSNVKIVGLTATPFRLDSGSLIDSGLFTNIAYDIELVRLIDEGFLSPVVSRVSKQSVDMSGVRKSGYDYNQTESEKIFDPETERHCEEIIKLGNDRKHWLIFASGIKHAEHISDCLNSKGVLTTFVHGELLNMERDRRINAFKAGEFKAIVNCEILTTGFNFRPIDLLVLLRATQSTALFVQMCGRGTRTAEGKKDCLVLDFGGNIDRHGPLDLIKIKSKRKGKPEILKLPAKKCPECGTVVAIRCLKCPTCEYEFPASSTKLEVKPSDADIISRPRDVEIDDAVCKVHRKVGKPDSFRIDYKFGIDSVSDFLCFEHGGFAAEMAKKKWMQRLGKFPFPQTVQEAYQRQHELAPVQSITIRKDGKYNRIVKMVLQEKFDIELDDGLPNL